MTDILVGTGGIVALGGALWIALSKASLLADLPGIYRWDKERIGAHFYRLVFRTKAGKLLSSPEYFLQKILSGVRVIALRIEHATGTRLEDLRQRTKETKEKFSQPYWDRIKKPKSKKSQPKPM
ncbi:MAG: hypothetical protein HYW98_00985 [Candidatus Wildermuthbacteria bacterium]|nr:hypothetical protein [Candidatus Wildermuthbacteria bacterium]